MACALTFQLSSSFATFTKAAIILSSGVLIAPEAWRKNKELIVVEVGRCRGLCYWQTYHSGLHPHGIKLALETQEESGKKMHRHDAQICQLKRNTEMLTVRNLKEREGFYQAIPYEVHQLVFSRCHFAVSPEVHHEQARIKSKC